MMLTLFLYIVSILFQDKFAHLTAPKGEPETKNPPWLCSFRSIPTETDSDRCFETINEWIHDCKENHEACGLSCASNFPTRVLDIQGHDARLVEDLTEKGNYVALSHCWGERDIFKTIRNTFQLHKECIKLRSMPQNFKDAIHISKLLGYKYIWIDSLCIIQEDNQDWAEQSGHMEDVYHNADLVIAATCASNSKEGFLVGDRPTYREGTVSITLQDTDKPTIFYYRLTPPHRCREGPLDRRGWAFQERLCARRYVSFGPREVTWSCQTTTRCECDSVEVVDENRRYRERNLELYLPHTPAQELHGHWRRDIVPFYTQRELTKSSDKLRALSAIAAWFGRKLKSNYIVGLWEQDLILDLLWSTKKPGRREEFEGPSKIYYNAPTWTWITFCGWTYYPLFRDALAIRLATLVGSHIPNTLLVPQSVPQFGRIVLRGKLVSATITHNPSAEVPNVAGPFVVSLLHVNRLVSSVVNPDIFPPTHQNRVVSGGNQVHRQKWHPGELQDQPYPVWVLFMAFYPSHRFLYGLILVQSTEHLAAYCRVGLVTFDLRGDDEDINEILNLWDDKQVVMV